ncbi:MAG TPA: hypothetical protein VFB62_23650, partial [Polyangiaceae bacterium]|nr:hypothetical protein [Polyangiaceae bacterium]
SRLAEWLCERAEELGCAVALKAVHGRVPGPRDGLAGMLTRHFRCEGVAPSALRAHLERQLSSRALAKTLSLDVLIELLRPSMGGDEPAVHFATADERHASLRGLVEALCARRPVILWLDDAHWGFDALAFALHLLTDGPFELPVLVVLTVRSEALPDRPAEAEMLERISAQAGAERLAVEPLPEADRSRLVSQLLRIEDELAVQVATRSSGNPLFALQLVGHWIDRGLLEAGPHGFALKPGVAMTPPEDLHGVWNARIERLLEERPEHDAVALELAALLGQDVDGGEWRRACAELSIDAAPALVNELLSRRLASTGERGPEDGWSFVHAMLRECLEWRSRAAGRAERLHRACAHMLARERARPGLAERLGRHLMLGGDSRAAAEPLLVAAREHMEHGNLAMASVLLAEREQGLWDHAGDIALICDGWMLTAEVARRRALALDAQSRASQAVALARKLGDARRLARALELEARTCMQNGGLAVRRDELEEAERLATATGDTVTLAACHKTMAEELSRSGELSQATERYARALDAFHGIGDVLGEASCRVGLAFSFRQTGQLDEAWQECQSARSLFERAGSRFGIVDCLVLEGEIARSRGNVPIAEERYTKAHELCIAIGHGKTPLAKANLALVLIERGEIARAGLLLEEALRVVASRGNARWEGLLHIVLLVCAAHARAWRAWDAHMERGVLLIEATEAVDQDIALMAERASEQARERGELERGRQALELACAQWRALGRDEDAERASAAWVSSKRPRVDSNRPPHRR